MDFKPRKNITKVMRRVKEKMAGRRAKKAEKFGYVHGLNALVFLDDIAEQFSAYGRGYKRGVILHSFGKGIYEE